MRTDSPEESPSERVIAEVIKAIRSDLQTLLGDHLQEVQGATARIVEAAMERMAPLDHQPAPPPHAAPVTEDAGRAAQREKGPHRLAPNTHVDPPPGLTVLIPVLGRRVPRNTVLAAAISALLGGALGFGLRPQTVAAPAVTPPVPAEEAPPAISTTAAAVRDLSEKAREYDVLFVRNGLGTLLDEMSAATSSVNLHTLVVNYRTDPFKIGREGAGSLLNALTQHVLKTADPASMSTMALDGDLRWPSLAEPQRQSAPALRAFLEKDLARRYNTSLQEVTEAWEGQEFPLTLKAIQRALVVDFLRER